MPKKTPTTPLLGRSSPFTGAPASAVTESPTVQNTRRKLQYNSQLPIPCAGKKPTIQLVGSLKKFPVKRPSDKQQLPESGKKKSTSMIDLSSAVRKRGTREPVGTRQDTSSGSVSARLVDPKTEAEVEVAGGCAPMRWPAVLRRDEGAQRDSRAASLVCRVLVVNAWRRRRVESGELRAALAGVTQQVDHLQLQIVVLRKLLDKENSRVASLAGELHRAKAQADETAQERDQLRIAKEGAEVEARKEHEIVEEQSVTVENLRNELRSARDQIDTLDKQIARDREKLLRVREERKALLEKLSASEALAEERNARATKAELSLEDTQMQLATQLAVTSSLQEEVQRCLSQMRDREEQKAELEDTVLRLEKENTRLDERLRLGEETERTLGSRAEYLESQLVHQEMKIRRIQAECNAQMAELNDLRERVLRQSQECGWSDRVLQLAGSFVRAPTMLLRTLSFFSSSTTLIF
ncbi:nuclear mitotic apparatus protein 1-like [Copidosoma floridanum]|uniref:nuclear mitotic apparatus protein 1-like n=1 Tax=Copidosoma floridanum TaxID=29053 RepID=UPI0006C9BB91|nr:nuclear mitotic apparatus protein 1-like [Copidosoma floridanum]